MIVFLSYSSKDKDFVRRLAYDLKQEYINVWIDEANLHVGSNLSAILSKIKEAAVFIVVMSKSSQQSDWVKREIDLAKKISHIKILPVVIEDISGGWGGDIARKAVADFQNPFEYRRSFYELVSAIKNTPKPHYFKATEAVRLVRNEKNPSGVLFGISHQGVATLYTLSEAREWIFADSMGGASRLWVVEFFDIQKACIQTYVVKDGKIHECPVLYLLDSDPQPVPNSIVVFSTVLNEEEHYSEQAAKAIIANTQHTKKVDKRYAQFRPIPITRPYIDSDTAIYNAIKSLNAKDKFHENSHVFTLMKLEHDKRLGGFLIWNVSFFDLTLEESILTVGVDAVTGEVKYPSMRCELLNANFFHMRIENGNYVIDIKRQLKAIESHIWDIPSTNQNAAKGLTADEAMNMASDLLKADPLRQWQFGFISNTGVLDSVLSPRFRNAHEGLMKRDGTAGQWVIEVYTGAPRPIVEGDRKGFACEFIQVLITREDGAKIATPLFICNFTASLSQLPLPSPLLNAYEKARTLAIKNVVVGFSVMSVTLDRLTTGAEWRFRFYDSQNIIQRIRVSGDGLRIIEAAGPS